MNQLEFAAKSERYAEETSHRHLIDVNVTLSLDKLIAATRPIPHI